MMDWTIASDGVGNIPRTGPAVIASNHLSHLDFLFLGYAARGRARLVRFMAMKEAFDHRLAGPLLRGMRHIPVDRRRRPAESFDEAIAALRQGEVVGLHPEGRIRRPGMRSAPKSGAVRMALATGAPLIPAAVRGTRAFLGPGARLRLVRHVPISVVFGPAMEVDPSRTLRESTDRLMVRIADLEG